MVNERGLSQEETARWLSILSGTRANRVADSKSRAGRSGPDDPSVAELADENRHLRTELNEARVERGILKKAAANFAKESLPGVHESEATALPAGSAQTIAPWPRLLEPPCAADYRMALDLSAQR